MGLQPWVVGAALLLRLLLAVGASTEEEASRCFASTGAQFMSCLNGTTQGVPLVVTLQGDVYLHPEDWAPYAPWLPIHTDQTTVTIAGAPGLPASPTLDFGGAVALSHHGVGTVWVMENMRIQGMATHSAGYAGAARLPLLGFEMVNGVLWPTTTGEPGHWMVFRNATIVPSPGSPCGGNATLFKVDSLKKEAGREGGIEALGNGSYLVSQLFEGSYPVRDLRSGQSVGNVLFSFENVTVACPPLQAPPSGAPPPFPTPLAAASGSGIAGNAKELLFYLGVYDINEILLAGHINLLPSDVANASLPLVIARGRGLTLRSHDGKPKVLDFGQIPRLLTLEETANLTFANLELQGVAFPSAVYESQSIQIEGSPLWPTLEGVPGHTLSFQDCTLHAVQTPCSSNSTQIEVDLLKRAMGADAVVRAGDTRYTILRPSSRTVYYHNLTTKEQLYTSQYFYTRTTVACLEDPGISLAHEILATWSPPGSQASASAPATGSSGGSSSAVIAGAAVGATVGAAALAALIAGLLVRRQRQRRQLAAQQGQQAEGPHEASLTAMESGDLSKALVDLPGKPSGDLELLPLQDPTDPTQAPNCSAVAKNTLWRSKFGPIEGLEVYELLGRGAFGRVYKGRWGGALVAIKVVEHRVVAGRAYDLSREPLLSLSVSHPNCITSYKLSILRVLTPADRASAGAGAGAGASSAPAMTSGEYLPVSDGSQGSDASSPRLSRDALVPAGPPGALPAASQGDSSAGSGASGSTHPSTAAAAGAIARPSRSSGGSSQGSGRSVGCKRGTGRRLQSLLSGAEAVEILSTAEALQPGLYETWIISELCDQRTLGEAIAEGKLRLAGGAGGPDMLAVYLTLLDVALGLEYLHNDLNILHGDLKPTNVLLKGARNDRRGWVAKLGDFGLSRLLGASDTHVDTSSVGTPSHAAPEVLAHGRMTKQGDVFAFGMIAWELVSGEAPYPGMLAVQIILQVVQQGYRPPIPEACPPALAALMSRCWHQDPQARPPISEVVREVKDQILEWRREHGGAGARAPAAPRRSTDSAMAS